MFDSHELVWLTGIARLAQKDANAPKPRTSCTDLSSQYPSRCLKLYSWLDPAAYAFRS